MYLVLWWRGEKKKIVTSRMFLEALSSVTKSKSIHKTFMSLILNTTQQNGTRDKPMMMTSRWFQYTAHSTRFECCVYVNVYPVPWYPVNWTAYQPLCWYKNVFCVMKRNEYIFFSSALPLSRKESEFGGIGTLEGWEIYARFLFDCPFCGNATSNSMRFSSFFFLLVV